MKKAFFLFLGFVMFAISVNAQPPATYSSSWNQGQTILRSPNGKYHLDYQRDGNLVLYQGRSDGYWSTKTSGLNSNSLNFQGDGNLVIYNNNKSVWASGSHSRGGKYIVLQDDGNLVIYTLNNRPVWSTNTSR